MSDYCPSCSYEDVLKELRKEFPSYRVIRKEDSRLMRAIGWFLSAITLGAMSTFMTDFVTTIGFTVYVPERWALMSYDNRTVVMRHERVHMRQRRKYGTLLFTLLYLLFPLPGGLAYFRMKFEREAYEETLRAMVDLFQVDGRILIQSKEYRAQILSFFLGPSYFWMWPFRTSMEAWYDQACRDACAAPRPAILRA